MAIMSPVRARKKGARLLAMVDEKTGRVLLTGLSVDGERLLVVPREWCIAEVGAHGTLEQAGTFGEVRKDRGAWRQVEDGISEYLERLYGDGEIDEDVPQGTARRRYASGSASFDADNFFADEDQNWRADVLLSSERWLATSEPELSELFCRADTGWGISYTPSDYVPAEARDLFERMLVRLGYAVLQLDDLHSLYLDSPAGRRAVLARLSSAKPLRGRKSRT